jgi:hypothetical protein
LPPVPASKQSIEIGSKQTSKYDSCSNMVDEIANEDDVGLKELVGVLI